jgi:recombination protein RecA
MEAAPRHRALEALTGERVMKKKKIGLSAVKDTVGAVEKRFGKGAIMTLDDDAIAPHRAFSTGSVGLDKALGIGGLPYGRVVEIFGPESSGKTTLTLHAVREVQAEGGVAAFIDAEHALDLGYAKGLGVDPSGLLLSQPDCGEDALEIAEMLTRTEGIDLVVIDSVAALTPRAEIEGDMGDNHVGLQARLMSQALRKLNAAVSQSGTTVIFINQLRQKIGVTFGSGETTTGGNALKFYSSVRLDIRRIATLKDNDGEPFANRVRVKVIKNKVAPPFRRCEFELFYGRGICQAGEIIDLALESGLITKSGAWYSWGERRLGQGREKVRDAINEDAELRQALRTAVMGAPASTTPSATPSATEQDAA